MREGDYPNHFEAPSWYPNDADFMEKEIERKEAEYNEQWLREQREKWEKANASASKPIDKGKGKEVVFRMETGEPSNRRTVDGPPPPPPRNSTTDPQWEPSGRNVSSGAEGKGKTVRFNQWARIRSIPSRSAIEYDGAADDDISDAETVVAATSNAPSGRQDKGKGKEVDIHDDPQATPPPLNIRKSKPSFAPQDDEVSEAETVVRIKDKGKGKEIDTEATPYSSNVEESEDSQTEAGPGRRDKGKGKQVFREDTARYPKQHTGSWEHSTTPRGGPRRDDVFEPGVSDSPKQESISSEEWVAGASSGGKRSKRQRILGFLKIRKPEVSPEVDHHTFLMKRMKKAQTPKPAVKEKWTGPPPGTLYQQYFIERERHLNKVRLEAEARFEAMLAAEARLAGTSRTQASHTYEDPDHIGPAPPLGARRNMSPIPEHSEYFKKTPDVSVVETSSSGPKVSDSSQVPSIPVNSAEMPVKKRRRDKLKKFFKLRRSKAPAAAASHPAPPPPPPEVVAPPAEDEDEAKPRRSISVNVKELSFPTGFS